MKDEFLRKILPLVHKKIGSSAVYMDVLRFFEDPSLLWHFDDISGQIMKLLVLDEQECNLLLAYLYVNIQEQPEDYKNIKTFTQPQSRTITVDKDEFWTVRETETFTTQSYFPSMAAFMVENGQGESVGKDDLDWVERDSVNYTDSSS